MNNELTEFLDHSNRIEHVYEKEALVDARKAWDYLIEKNLITVNCVFEAHRILMERFLDEKEAGKMRMCNVMIGNNLCPDHTLVAGLFEDWRKNSGDANTEESIEEAHVKFEKIHPFVDGNGRIGRIILNWQRIKAKLSILIVHVGKEQMEYYKWFR